MIYGHGNPHCLAHTMLANHLIFLGTTDCQVVSGRWKVMVESLKHVEVEHVFVLQPSQCKSTNDKIDEIMLWVMHFEEPSCCALS